MSAGKLLPRAILIDMDDGILSAHGRPEIAWTNADAPWRLKLAEARHLTVKGGFAALAAAGHRALPDDLAMSPADRFTSYREEDMSIGPGVHDAIDRLKALGVKLALVTKGAADTQRTMLQRLQS